MIKNPTNYMQWCQIFDEIEQLPIGKTDVNLLSAIDNGKLEWTSGVAERYTERLLKLINNRIDKLDNFYKKRNKNFYDQFEISNVLTLIKKELSFLKYLSLITVLPDDVSEDISEQIMEIAKEKHEDLLQWAKNDTTGNIKNIVLGLKIYSI